MTKTKTPWALLGIITAATIAFGALGPRVCAQPKQATAAPVTIAAPVKHYNTAQMQAAVELGAISVQMKQLAAQYAELQNRSTALAKIVDGDAGDTATAGVK